MITEADLRNNEVVTSDPAAALRALYAHTDAMRDLRDDVARAIGAKR